MRHCTQILKPRPNTLNLFDPNLDFLFRFLFQLILSSWYITLHTPNQKLFTNNFQSLYLTAPHPRMISQPLHKLLRVQGCEPEASSTQVVSLSVCFWLCRRVAVRLNHSLMNIQHRLVNCKLVVNFSNPAEARAGLLHLKPSQPRAPNPQPIFSAYYLPQGHIAAQRNIKLQVAMVAWGQAPVNFQYRSSSGAYHITPLSS